MLPLQELSRKKLCIKSEGEVTTPSNSDTGRTEHLTSSSTQIGTGVTGTGIVHGTSYRYEGGTIRPTISRVMYKDFQDAAQSNRKRSPVSNIEHPAKVRKPEMPEHEIISIGSSPPTSPTPKSALGRSSESTAVIMVSRFSGGARQEGLTMRCSKTKELHETVKQAFIEKAFGQPWTSTHFHRSMRRGTLGMLTIAGNKAISEIRQFLMSLPVQTKVMFCLIRAEGHTSSLEHWTKYVQDFPLLQFNIMIGEEYEAWERNSVGWKIEDWPVEMFHRRWSRSVNFQQLLNRPNEFHTQIRKTWEIADECRRKYREARHIAASGSGGAGRNRES